MLAHSRPTQPVERAPGVRGNAMAVLRPSDIATSASRRPRADKPLHPVWGLIGGFGLICLAALVVDLVFRLF